MNGMRHVADIAPRPAPARPLRVKPAIVAFNEGEGHRAAKAALATALRERGLAVEVEAAAGPGRRADLLVRSPAGRTVAIEVQQSAIGIAEVRDRTADHARAGHATLWLPALDLRALRLRPVHGTAGRTLYARWAVPGWIDWLSARSGALWLWSDDALWRAWLEPAFVRTSTWEAPPDPADCGWACSPRLRTLVVEGPVLPSSVRLMIHQARADMHDRFEPLPGPCARFVRAGEHKPAACPVVIDWESAAMGVRPVVRLAPGPQRRLH
jgi:hypothetical protein